MPPFGFHSLGFLSFHCWVGCALFSQHLLKIQSESTKVKPFEGDSFPLSILCRQSQWPEEGQLNESVGNLKKFSNPTSVRRAKHICAKSQRNISCEKNGGTREDHLEEVVSIRFKFSFSFKDYKL